VGVAVIMPTQERRTGALWMRNPFRGWTESAVVAFGGISVRVVLDGTGARLVISGSAVRGKAEVPIDTRTASGLAVAFDRVNRRRRSPWRHDRRIPGAAVKTEHWTALVRVQHRSFIRRPGGPGHKLLAMPAWLLVAACVVVGLLLLSLAFLMGTGMAPQRHERTDDTGRPDRHA
jgi:hypothetical protein